MIKRRVTTGQFYSLLYICSVVAAFMFVSTPVIDLGTTDAVLFPVVFGVLSFITVIPSLEFYKKSDGESILNAVEKNSKGMSIFLAIAYTVLVFILLLRTLARLDLFISSEIFPENTMTFFIVIIIIASTFLSLLGITALSRAATIFLVMVIISVSVVITAAFSNIETYNIQPLFINGPGVFLKQALSYSVFFPETACLVLFLSHMKGDIKKGYFVYICSLVLSLSVVAFTVVGALGEFCNTQLFPAFAISSVGEFRILERFESIQSSVWTTCIVAKTTLQIMIVSDSLRHIFKKMKWWAPNFLVGVLSIAAMLYISAGVTRFTFMSEQTWVTVIYVLLVVILPFIGLISIRKKEKVSEYAEKQID